MYTIIERLERIESKLSCNSEYKYRGIIDNVTGDGLTQTMRVAFVVNDSGDGYLIANQTQDAAIKAFDAALRDNTVDWTKGMGNGTGSMVIEDFSPTPNYHFKLKYGMGGVERVAIASKVNHIWRYYYIASVKVPFATKV